jgi:hypothetical protein
LGVKYYGYLPYVNYLTKLFCKVCRLSSAEKSKVKVESFQLASWRAGSWRELRAESYGVRAGRIKAVY